MTPDPSQIRPLGARILVRTYTKPETVKGLEIPEAYRADDTGSLWEVVGPMGPRVHEVLGITPAVGDLIKTPPFRGVHIGADLYFIEAAEVASVYQW